MPAKYRNFFYVKRWRALAFVFLHWFPSHEFAKDERARLSDTWRPDELYVKVKGDMKYVFALIDDETRNWIAQEVAETKYQHDDRHLFEMGKELMDKRPLVLITDGLPAYHDARLRRLVVFSSPCFLG